MLTAVDPTTGKIIREVEPVDSATMNSILDNAEKAYQSWRKTSFKERSDLLKRVAQRMRDDIENLAFVMTEEMGKPIKEAYGEVTKAAWCADHYADNAESYLATETIQSDATLSYVEYQPLGPVLGVLPWNAPFWLAFRFCAPTLMAGNTCVMKHDPHVPGCAQAIANVFKEVNAPDNIMQNLALETPQVEAAIRDNRIRGVSFTGSGKGGSAVASMAASSIKPAVLELGGSDPCIVLDDANLEEAADIIKLSRIINAGQSCIAVKRIIVEKTVYDPFIALLKDKLAALVVGDPRKESTDIGPIARDDLRQNLHRQVEQTINAGAKCLLGGQMPDSSGFFYPVTLLTDVDETMTASCEETFGPIAVVMKAENEAHAMEIANNTPYGLAASVWTNRERGERMAKELEAGQVSVNGIVKTDPRLPSGGIKQSGYGRELGPHGIKEFVNAKQIWIGPKCE